MTQSDRKVYRIRPKRWRKVLGFTLSFLPLVLMVGGFFAWSWHAESRLAAQLETYRLRGEPVTIADITPPPVPDEQNAALDLRLAAREIDTDSEQWKRLLDLEWVRPLTEQERELLEHIAEANAAVLPHIERATAKPGVNWQLEYVSPLNDMDLGALKGQIAVAQHLKVLAVLSHFCDDDQTAMARIEQLQFVARAANTEALLIPYLIAAGVEALATNTLLAICPDLEINHAAGASEQQVSQMIVRLLDDEPVRAGYHRALAGERVFDADVLSSVAEEGSLAGRLVIRRFVRASTYHGNRWTTEIMTAAKAQTWPAFVEEALPTMDEAEESRAITKLLASTAVPGRKRAALVQYQIIADRRLAAAALAVRWYVVDHGEWPESLETLVPEYLPHVPDDPFDPDGGPIRYVADPERPILYSVGENGIDNGGSETPRREGRKTVRRWDTEDAVVHLSQRRGESNR